MKRNSDSTKPTADTASDAVEDSRSGAARADLRFGKDYATLERRPRGVPDDGIRVAFLQTCLRLNIPKKKWPQFGGQLVVHSPGSLKGIFAVGRPPKIVIQLPAFGIFDDLGEWEKAANKSWEDAWKKQVEPYLHQCKKLQKSMTEPGKRRRFGGEKRESIPMGIRLELAAKRYCLECSWPELVKSCDSAYRADRIRKSVSSLLSELKLLIRK